MKVRPVEAYAKVALIIGKRATVDARNRYFYGGKFGKEPIKGFGYDRCILRALGPMAGTMMAVDPSEPKVERFIPLAGDPRILRYNSRLPIVVYVPDGVEVRYRVWGAEPNATTAEKG